MKSRKFKAVLAAVSAIAVLATAMTGFAATNATISTVTKYNLNDTKAEVTTTVSTLSVDDAQVTLLVKTADDFGVDSSGIAYIDQKAASDGTAVFTYQLNKNTLGATNSVVITSGNDSSDGTLTDDLGVKPLADVSSDGYTITYDKDAYGEGDIDTVTATVAPQPGYEITDVKVNGESKGMTFTVNPNEDTITVTAQAVATAPAVTNVTMNATQNAAGKYENTVVMKLLNSQPTIGVGVIYDEVFYPAMNGVSVGGTFAVQLIADSDITKAITTFVE